MDEAAGVEFTNGGQPGVRMKARQPSQEFPTAPDQLAAIFMTRIARGSSKPPPTRFVA
jgi:hypothetical protein